MKRLRTNPIVKGLAVLLTLITLTGGFWCTLYTLTQWDDLWYNNSYYSSNICYLDMSLRRAQVESLAHLNQKETLDGELSYLEQQQLDDLIEQLSPEETNFRFRLLRNDTGALVYSNGPGTTADLEAAVHEVYRESLTIYPEEVYAFTGSMDDIGYLAELVVEYGVADPLTVEDEFWAGQQDYSEFTQYLPEVALGALILDACTLLLLFYLIWAAGWRKGRETAVCSWLDRIPLDLLSTILIVLIVLILCAGDSISYAANTTVTPDIIAGLAIVSVSIAACVLIFPLTLATRVRTRTLLSNNLIAMLCRAVGRAAAAWPMTWRVVLFFLLYLLGTLLTGLTIILIPFYQGFVLWALCRWAIQWRRVREGTGRIVGGDPDYKIDTAKMYRDLREHAEALNDLGGAIGSAVEERVKSERFKTELITNVSHDLKTPLTSIINYVDLLKKEPMDNPRAAEYIEVLDRKSQRLKKLTEDLVEASKASAGTLTVNRERLGMGQLIRQALGEYEEKLTGRHLQLIASLPDGELYVEADGRHLWRVLDNLLGNCCKYAMEGTRIYLELLGTDGNVVFLLKNISQNPLNIPPEQLMERFVRGDAARTTEGSGLGLSIARSLTELQGGTFTLEIDGDLFKARVTFPQAPPPREPSAAL